MMWFWLVVLVLLAIAALLLVVPALREPQRDEALDRDRLNKRFYQQRLQELEQDEAQGVVAERGVMVQELQQNLLSDIPQQSEQAAKPLSRWALLPGVVILVVIAVGFYLKSGGLTQVQTWHHVMQEMPQLRERVMNEDKKPLTMEEIARLGLGLRSELQHDPRNVADWVMLGRIGMALNNATTATQAFAHAYQLAPEEPDVVLGYAEVLTRSGDPLDNQHGAELLNGLLKQNHQDIRTLSLLAFNAFEQGNFQQAIGAWEMMLKLLPADDSRRAVLQRSIEQAKAQAGVDNNVRLTVNVTLSPETEAQLPPQSVLIISVSDGTSPVPVAVKQLPLGHFPLTVTLDDSNAMMPERLLSGLKQIKVRARVSRDGLAMPEAGDWYGDSAVAPYDKQGRADVQIDRQMP